MKKLLFISLFAALLLAGCSKDEGPGGQGPKIPNNEIWYTSYDGNIVKPYKANFGGAEILSNTYEDGKGVIKFNAPVTEIGQQAFERCYNLTSITIPDSVTTIISNPFRYCSGLTAFYGKFASEDNKCLIVDGMLNSFAIGCGATEYTIPDGVTKIGDVAFDDCSSLTSITIPDSVTKIGNYAFGLCRSLTSITIPDSVTTIGYNPFQRCKGLTAFYGKFASDDNRCLIVNGELISFAPAGLTEYAIPDGVTKIGYIAFDDCSSLTSIDIPDGVTEIGQHAFAGCSRLESITIPDGVTTIELSAFEYCSSLTNVYCRPATPPTMSTYVFHGIDDNAEIYVPRASVEAYKAAENWSDYADLIQPYDF